MVEPSDQDRYRKRCPECGREIYIEESENGLCFVLRCKICRRYEIAFLEEEECEDAFLALEDYEE